jgi:hypothetical protein
MGHGEAAYNTTKRRDADDSRRPAMQSRGAAERRLSHRGGPAVGQVFLREPPPSSLDPAAEHVVSLHHLRDALGAALRNAPLRGAQSIVGAACLHLEPCSYL